MRVAVALAAAGAALAAGCSASADAAGGGGGSASPSSTAPTRSEQPESSATPEAEPTEKKPETKPAEKPKAEASASKTPTEEPTPEGPEVLMAVGDESEQVRELQARLRAEGVFGQSPTAYYGPITADAVSAFQEDRGLPRTGETDVVTWERLLARTDEPTHDELYPPTSQAMEKPDPRCTEGRVLCVSKRSDSLRWMKDGEVLAAMDVRFGSQYTPTREGVFEVFLKSRHHVSTLYDTPMPYAMFFSGGQAVHYSADFAATGYAGASHGCVNVRDEAKIAKLFGEVRVGDKVVVYG
ncbi:L,D-transpeptidase family protein [Streptomyces sp. WMMC500]|uniref:L,D-transpeptidase family protein n=1 Tax=Streptomyces sp. WMMC500 TaxID=3015154 RepID=UPI00248CF9F0|nr:peptidoglycan-binding protein [Streptomyces sp. WMMC500]WBB63592.1 L,D-transpeptidase family protein [Streptomyces sp. WMMC500]